MKSRASDCAQAVFSDAYTHADGPSIAEIIEEFVVSAVDEGLLKEDLDDAQSFRDEARRQIDSILQEEFSMLISHDSSEKTIDWHEVARICDTRFIEELGYGDELDKIPHTPRYAPNGVTKDGYIKPYLNGSAEDGFGMWYEPLTSGEDGKEFCTSIDVIPEVIGNSRVDAWLYTVSCNRVIWVVSASASLGEIMDRPVFVVGALDEPFAHVAQKAFDLWGEQYYGFDNYHWQQPASLDSELDQAKDAHVRLDAYAQREVSVIDKVIA
jgi:hypothetical protein